MLSFDDTRDGSSSRLMNSTSAADMPRRKRSIHNNNVLRYTR